jgi:hypothetical protein
MSNIEKSRVTTALGNHEKKAKSEKSDATATFRITNSEI